MSTELQTVYDECARCNRCGFCQAVCPIFDITKDERSVARGHNSLIRNLIEGKLDVNSELKSPLFECLLCKSCVVNCFPGVETHKIVVQGRAEYLRQAGEPKMMHFLFHKLLPDHKRLGKYLKPVVWGKNSGMSKLGRSLGVLKWFRRDLDKAEDIVEKLPKQSFRDKLPNITLSPPNPTEKIGYFVGCGFNFVLPHCSEATIDVLVRQGLQVTVPDTGCCGLPAYVYGDLEAAKKMARKNIEYLESLGVDTILTECASCSSFLKDYAELLADDPDWSERASQISKKIVGFSEYMVDKLPEVEDSTFTPLKVTYHDPCHMCRYQNVTQEPRQLLKQTPGVEFVELPEADLCCGAAGSYNIMHYNQSMVVLDRKMKNLQNIEADVLTTECPGCCIQLSYGVRKSHLPTKVLHISELIRDRFWSNHK